MINLMYYKSPFCIYSSSFMHHSSFGMIFGCKRVHHCNKKHCFLLESKREPKPTLFYCDLPLRGLMLSKKWGNPNISHIYICKIYVYSVIWLQSLLKMRGWEILANQRHMPRMRLKSIHLNFLHLLLVNQSLGGPGVKQELEEFCGRLTTNDYSGVDWAC